MSQTSFSIAYDGPAVESGSMDVRDLAPALLAVGQLFDAANLVLNGQKATIGVNVQATTQGSFEVVLDVVQRTASRLGDIFSSDEITAALQLKDLVLAGRSSVYGLIKLAKKLRGHSPQKVEEVGDGIVRITYGSETIDVPAELLRLYGDVNVRDSLERAIKEPLDKDGIDIVEIRQEGVSVESISAKESTYFGKPDIPDELLVQTTSITAYSIVSLAFKQDNKWRLHDGNAVISVLIADGDFLRKVDESLISFAKGDILICKVETIQRRVGTDLKAEYSVLEVIEHKPAARQLDLPIVSGTVGSDEPRDQQTQRQTGTEDHDRKEDE